MSEYYFDISFAGISSAYYGKALSRVFHALHGAIFKESDGEVGLSFPGWKDGRHDHEVSLGGIVRVVSSDKDRLIRVSTRYDVDIEVDLKELSANKIDVVPETADRAVFARSRIQQRYRHFMKHGDLDGKIAAKTRMGVERALPKIFVTSATTDQSFLMRIDKRDPATISKDRMFDNYGLSSGRSVPVW